MKTRTITIAGGSGFLGKVLENHFSQSGNTIYILTRTPNRNNDIYWNAKELDNWTDILEQTDILINLTGKSVDCRYTEANKKLIHDSRIDSTCILGKAVNNCKNPPEVWLNMSTSTIYEGSYSKEMTETN
jgi:NAD dependent epimerase/dehydratase family enzyme